MGRRGAAVLGGVVVAALAAGGGYAYVWSDSVHGSPEKVARDYFTAWENGDLGAMADLVADPPADFGRQHRALSQGLLVSSIEIKQGRLVRGGSPSGAAARSGSAPSGSAVSGSPGPAGARAEAREDFQVSRRLAGAVTWSFRSSLRLGVRDHRWKVLWTPATLHPALRGPVTWKLSQVEAPAATFTDRDGGTLDKEGPLQPYIAALTERFGDTEDSGPGWAIDTTDGGGRAARLAVIGGAAGRKIRTTLDPRSQKAAEKAVDAEEGAAAIVALRPSTGQVLAVADGLGGLNAFLGGYPPGSTFKVVTAAGLLDRGMSPGSGADCPNSVVTAQRTIVNHDGLSLGGTSLRNAFAQSCNTTFARLAVERLGAPGLAGAARAFGFDGPIAPGPAAARGSFPKPENGAELAEAAIGQGRVQASPLVMALIAAAVEDGTWRSPRLLDAKLIRGTGDRPQPAHPVPGAAALRTMMRAVVTDGTAAGAGLPSGTSGKTGTAETGDGDHAHAWFIGYRGDLAFAVFIENGGSGPKAAAPLAARFLHALS